MSDVNLAVTAPLNSDAPLYTPAPTINYRKQKGNLFDVGADVNINPANNQQSLSGTTAVAATIKAGTLASSFANGQVIDGVTLSTGNVILVKDQVLPKENGVYTVQASGAPVRHTSWDSGVELQAFQQTVYISGGTVNAKKFFVQTKNVLSPYIVPDTTDLIFKEDSNQMVNQKAILADTAIALQRQNVKPLDAPPNARLYGGVFTWDNSTLEQFFAKQPVRAATTGPIVNKAACPVLQDGVTLIEGDRLLVKNGAAGTPYTAVVAATAVALPANTYDPGTLGVGATLTGPGTFAVIGLIDGVAVVPTNRILVKNEANAAHNGIYTLTQDGNTTSVSWILTRATDMDQTAEFDTNKTIPVAAGGTANGGKSFILAAAVPAVGTSDANFNEYASMADKDNGIYVVGAVSGPNAPLTRAVDASENWNGTHFDRQVRFGMCVFVKEGTVNGKSTFFQATANPITIDTTVLEFRNLTTVMTTNRVNQPVDGNKNVDSQAYAQA
jgi:hypothetical protein